MVVTFAPHITLLLAFLKCPVAVAALALAASADVAAVVAADVGKAHPQTRPRRP